MLNLSFTGLHGRKILETQEIELISQNKDIVALPFGTIYHDTCNSKGRATMSWFCVIHSIYLVSSISVSVKIEYDTPL